MLKRDFATALSCAIPNITTWHKIGQALMGSQPNDMPSALIMSLCSIVIASVTGQHFLRTSISDYPNTVKFIVLRETFYNFNPIFRMKHTLVHSLLSLARKFVPRSVTADYMSREMVRPWLENPVWYDPQQVFY